MNNKYVIPYMYYLRFVHFLIKEIKTFVKYEILKKCQKYIINV